MLKVLKKIGLIKKEEASEKPLPINGDFTSKSFGGMGREKLRKDILKNKGMGKAPIPTAAGLALMQKQEVDKASSRINNDINDSNKKNSNYGSDSYGYISSMGITSSSLDKTTNSISMPVTPMMKVQTESSDPNSFKHIYESKNSENKEKIDNVNLPSLSQEANMTFNVENSIEIPSDSEIESIQQNQTLDFPGFTNIPFTPNSDKGVNNSLDFQPSFNTDSFIIQKTESKNILDNNLNNKPSSTLSLQSYEETQSTHPLSSSASSQDISLTLDSQKDSSINKKNLNQKLSSRVIAETIYTVHNEDLTGEDLAFAQELATIYSEGNLKYVIDALRNHLNQNNGTVPQRFWYMLMDCYQVEQNKVEFEKVAIAFAYLFSTSPPSWFESDEGVKKNVMSGKNIMILEPHFKAVQTEKFKTFLISSKEEKFCRINVSPCKFELSEYVAIEKLYELFKNLRKNKVLAILMGDNNLINFCKTYINPVMSNKTLKTDFIENEQTFWLLYLEILQWKGLEEEFEELALEFAMKFEISPPGWEKNGAMSLDKDSKLTDISNDDNNPSLDKYLTSNNIDILLEMINRGFQKSNKAEIDLSNVDTIDFAAAGSISYQIQELWSNPSYSQKKVIFRYPNEMILTLLEMVGVTEFIEIFNRKR